MDLFFKLVDSRVNEGHLPNNDLAACPATLALPLSLNLKPRVEAYLL